METVSMLSPLNSTYSSPSISTTEGQVIDIQGENLEADTSSYHCNVVRHISLDLIDPSLAIGFYCRNKVDFDDFCDRASKLADESNGAPLFTVTHTRNSPKRASQHHTLHDSGGRDEDSFDMVPTSNTEGTQEDDWQLL